MSCPAPCSALMQSYFVYSAILALKLLALGPMSRLVCNPEKIQRANISDLKNLTPFWLVSGLYMTTAPDVKVALTLLRLYVAVRIVSALGYIVKLPKKIAEMAFFVSFAITCYMSGHVAYTYRNSL